MSAESIAAAALAGLHSMNSDVIAKDLNKQVTQMKGVSGSRALTKDGVSKCNSVQTEDTQGPQNSHSASVPKKGKEEMKFPVEPRLIQIIKKPRTFMNHSYRDFSSVPPEVIEKVPTEISQMTFPQKVHHILSQPEYSRFICWQPHGRAFRIIVPKMFETKVCSKYMGHTRYSSFLRQLSNHSFKHITQGKDRNCYYHEFMLRGLPHLCKYMPKPKDARRLVPDPENEPDFYAISEKYPLPDEKEASTKQVVVEPKNESQMPRAGTPRLSSDRAMTTDLMPPAKRSRTSLPGSPVAPSQPMTAAASVESAAQQILATLVANNTLGQSNPMTTVNMNVNASALLGPVTNAVPQAACAPAPASQSPNVSLQLGGGGADAWSALRNPQMQAALDRNDVVLAALRAGIASQVANRTPQPPPPQPVSSPRADPAATLAAALLQQVVNNSNNGSASNDNNAALCTLSSLLAGAFR